MRQASIVREVARVVPARRAADRTSAGFYGKSWLVRGLLKRSPMKTLRTVLLALSTFSVTFALAGCDLGDLMSKLPF